MAALVGLWAGGQTLNLMTLGGLALAVGPGGVGTRGDGLAGAVDEEGLQRPVVRADPQHVAEGVVAAPRPPHPVVGVSVPEVAPLLTAVVTRAVLGLADQLADQPRDRVGGRVGRRGDGRQQAGRGHGGREQRCDGRHGGFNAAPRAGVTGRRRA